MLLDTLGCLLGHPHFGVSHVTHAHAGSPPLHSEESEEADASAMWASDFQGGVAPGWDGSLRGLVERPI